MAETFEEKLDTALQETRFESIRQRERFRAALPPVLAHVSTLTARVEELERALRPLAEFAAVMSHPQVVDPDELGLCTRESASGTVRITLGDAMRAAQAIAKGGERE